MPLGGGRGALRCREDAAHEPARGQAQGLRNLFDTFAKIATREGPPALWRFIPMWARIAPTTTLQLISSERPPSWRASRRRSRPPSAPVYSSILKTSALGSPGRNLARGVRHKRPLRDGGRPPFDGWFSWPGVRSVACAVRDAWASGSTAPPRGHERDASAATMKCHGCRRVPPPAITPRTCPRSCRRDLAAERLRHDEHRRGDVVLERPAQRDEAHRFSEERAHAAEPRDENPFELAHLEEQLDDVSLVRGVAPPLLVAVAERVVRVAAEVLLVGVVPPVVADALAVLGALDRVARGADVALGRSDGAVERRTALGVEGRGDGGRLAVEEQGQRRDFSRRHAARFTTSVVVRRNVKPARGRPPRPAWPSCRACVGERLALADVLDLDDRPRPRAAPPPGPAPRPARRGWRG